MNICSQVFSIILCFTFATTAWAEVDESTDRIGQGIPGLEKTTKGRIFVSWVVTIPAGAFLAIIFFYIFKLVLP